MLAFANLSPSTRRTILQLFPEYKKTLRDQAKVYYTNPSYRRMGVKVAYQDGRPPRYGLEPEEAAVVAKRTGGKVLETRSGRSGGGELGEDRATSDAAAEYGERQEAKAEETAAFADGNKTEAGGRSGGAGASEGGDSEGEGAGPESPESIVATAFADAEADFDGIADQVARLAKDPDVVAARKNHTQRIRQRLTDAVTKAQPPVIDGLDAGAFNAMQGMVAAVLTKSKSAADLAEGVRGIVENLSKRADKAKDPRGVGLAAMALAKNLSRVMWETLDAGDWLTGRIVSRAVSNYTKGVAELGRRAVKLAIAGSAAYGLGKGTMLAVGAMMAVGAPGIAIGVGILGGIATVAWALGPLHAAGKDFASGLPYLIGGKSDTGDGLALAWPWLFGTDKGKGGSAFPLPDLGTSGRLQNRPVRAASRAELQSRGIPTSASSGKRRMGFRIEGTKRWFPSREQAEKYRRKYGIEGEVKDVTKGKGQQKQKLQKQSKAKEEKSTKSNSPSFSGSNRRLPSYLSTQETGVRQMVDQDLNHALDLIGVQYDPSEPTIIRQKRLLERVIGKKLPHPSAKDSSGTDSSKKATDRSFSGAGAIVDAMENLAFQQAVTQAFSSLLTLFGKH